ncbi:MAG: baseplate assembly protein [Leptolyngbya sp. SIO4C5]|uniref:phage baseplate assembly protein V n=1 Tax=Sphaerothrix gracilis TaxID=3151835 RepID=UPI0013C22F91|nr:baseplate assembly protein [Leptolyngbya sp. SIO4C5]
MTNGERFYGKYRGTVTNNVDPLRLGRLQVTVSDVVGLIPSSWALPCFPWAGPQMGMYFIPPIGAGVWVEFEQGDPDFPIWVGCWWGDDSTATAQVPTTASAQTTPGLPVVVIQSVSQGSLVISDVPVPPMSAPGVMLNSGPASYITVDASGITLTAPTITLRAANINLTGITDINAGALKVT